jgi:predicted MPP superfamily phosphohydrolase
MYLIFILFFALIVLAIDTYFFRTIKYISKNLTPKKKKRVSQFYWSITIFVMLFLIASMFYFINKTPPPKFARVYVLGFVFIITVSKIIGAILLLFFDSFRFILFIINKTLYRKVEPTKSKNAISRAEFLKKAGLITAAIPFGTMFYGVVKSAFDYTIHRQNLVLKNLPNSFNGLKIIHLSDIHAGSFISDEPFKTAVELVNKENPDIIFFTGDLVNEISEEMLPFIDVLKNLKATFGVFSILGNHDYGDYFYQPEDIEGKKHNYKLMQEIHQKLGWKLLLNQNHIIEENNERLAILGVENWGDKGRFQKYGDINKAKEGCLDSDVKLLLSHDPSHWEAQILPNHPDIAATFSGHTHGMQFGVEIPGFKWSPSQYMYTQWAGLYQKGKQQIYVNRGLGFIGFPGRVGILPEITVFTLYQG